VSIINEDFFHVPYSFSWLTALPAELFWSRDLYFHVLLSRGRFLKKVVPSIRSPVGPLRFIDHVNLPNGGYAREAQGYFCSLSSGLPAVVIRVFSQ